MKSQGELLHEETALTAYLIRKVCDKAKGRAEDECLRNYPRDQYFIGNLRPFHPDDGMPGEDISDGEDYADEQDVSPFMREMRLKLAPVAFGADIQLADIKRDMEIEVVLRWNCYFRVFPSRQEQIEYQMWANNSGDPTPVSSETQSGDHLTNAEAANTMIDGVNTRRRGRRSTEDLCPKFRKIACTATGMLAAQSSDSGQWQIKESSLVARRRSGMLES